MTYSLATYPQSSSEQGRISFKNIDFWMQVDRILSPHTGHNKESQAEVRMAIEFVSPRARPAARRALAHPPHDPLWIPQSISCMRPERICCSPAS